MFERFLIISPDGVTWKNQHYPLEAITRIRWDNIKGRSEFGSYRVAFGDKCSEAVIELGEQHAIFIDKLWQVVGIRLLKELLETLKSGAEIRFGRALVRDEGIILFELKPFEPSRPICYFWYLIQIESKDGVLCISAKDDKKTYVELSYLKDANVYILEQALRVVLDSADMCRLSDVLKRMKPGICEATEPDFNSAFYRYFSMLKIPRRFDQTA